MRKFLFLFLTLTVSIMIGCEAESVNPLDQEIAAFKNQTAIQFQGKVLEHDISWVFDNWQNGIGALGEHFWCVTDDTSIQQRNFAIYDIEKRTHVTFLKIVSPALDIKDSYVIKKVIFEVGEKPFRLTDDSIYDGFIIEGVTKDEHFSTYYGPQDKSSIEIVKMEELLPDDPEQPGHKKIRVWTVVTCDLYDCRGQKMGTIDRGRFISEIQIERNK